tara:strand:- start:7094 stop:8224 length:1131 start_codon:yes stop_codon:yes gene_type:complete
LIIRPFIRILLIILAAVPFQAHAQTIDEQKASAQNALREGAIDDALSILGKLSAENPRDADILRRLAAAQAANGDFETAQRTIDQALVLAPNDYDIQLARANILLWRDKVAEADAQGRIVASAAPDYPGLENFRTALARRRAMDMVRISSASISQSVSRATFQRGDRQDWLTSEAALGLSLGPETNLTVQAEREERLATDTRLAARLDRRITGGLIYLAGSATPKSDFRESWSISAGIEKQISSGTHLLLDGRYAAYRGSDVAIVQTGVRQSLGGHFVLTARAINLFGGGESYRIGSAVRLDYASPGKTGYFVSAASYPDVEADGTRQLRGIATGIIAPLGKHLSLRATGAYEQRRDSYSRKAVTISMSWRFGQAQ